MDKDKVEWACRLSQDEWQVLLRARNRYVVEHTTLREQEYAKQNLLVLIQSELGKCND